MRAVVASPRRRRPRCRERRLLSVALTLPLPATPVHAISLATCRLFPSVARLTRYRVIAVSLVSSPRLALARTYVRTYVRVYARVLLFEPGRPAGRPAPSSPANIIRGCLLASRVCVRAHFSRYDGEVRPTRVNLATNRATVIYTCNAGGIAPRVRSLTEIVWKPRSHA
jgi:hypothetical protein